MSTLFAVDTAQDRILDGLSEAQREAVQRRREKNAAAHPFFWAAYTLTGSETRADPARAGKGS